MKRPTLSRAWTVGLPAALALAGLTAAWAVDRGSLERVNRLYRGGAVAQAASLYADRLARAPASEPLRYNLGTALLALADKGAGDALAAVGPKAEVEVQVRALNNLGLWRLTEAAKAAGSKAARTHATASVDAYKTALRLQPGRAETGWNLAIALRMLASIDAGNYVDTGEGAETGSERESGERPNGEPGDTKPEEGEEAGPKAGEGETAAARTGDAVPLSQGQAAEILGTGHRDPTTMVSKLMAFEGRTLRQRASGRPSSSGQK